MDQVMSALSTAGGPSCVCRLGALVVSVWCDVLHQWLQPWPLCEGGLGRRHVALSSAVSRVPMAALAVSVFQRRIVGTALTKRPVPSLPVSA